MYEFVEVKMDNSGLELLSKMSDRVPIMDDEIILEEFQKQNELETISLIRRNLEHFSESEPVLIATFRRLNDFFTNYNGEGQKLFIVKKATNLEPIACAGIGPLHGLPVSESMGELRDLVVDKEFRGQGIGTRLLHRCIECAKEMGYNRLYLKTSNDMINAKKLFLRSGFRPVTEKNATDSMQADLPCYFLLENLQNEV